MPLHITGDGAHHAPTEPEEQGFRLPSSGEVAGTTGGWSGSFDSEGSKITGAFREVQNINESSHQT